MGLPDFFSVHQLTPADVPLLRAMDALFGETFSDPESDHRTKYAARTESLACPVNSQSLSLYRPASPRVYVTAARGFVLCTFVPLFCSKRRTSSIAGRRL
jgi:hypothetical protein